MEANGISNTTFGSNFITHPYATEQEGQDVKMLAMSYTIFKIGKSFKYVLSFNCIGMKAKAKFLCHCLYTHITAKTIHSTQSFSLALTQTCVDISEEN